VVGVDAGLVVVVDAVDVVNAADVIDGGAKLTPVGADAGVIEVTTGGAGVTAAERAPRVTPSRPMISASVRRANAASTPRNSPRRTRRYFASLNRLRTARATRTGNLYPSVDRWR
jgi:hypothetical protein